MVPLRLEGLNQPVHVIRLGLLGSRSPSTATAVWVLLLTGGLQELPNSNSRVTNTRILWISLYLAGACTDRHVHCMHACNTRHPRTSTLRVFFWKIELLCMSEWISLYPHAQALDQRHAHLKMKRQEWIHFSIFNFAICNQKRIRPVSNPWTLSQNARHARLDCSALIDSATTPRFIHWTFMPFE